MGIFHYIKKLFWRRKTIDAIPIKELKAGEAQLTARIKNIQNEITDLEIKKSQLWEQAKKTKSRDEEISIARKIKGTSDEQKMKRDAQARLEKQRHAVSNIIIARDHNEDIRDSSLDIDPENVENWLAENKVKAEEQARKSSMIIEYTSSSMSTNSIDEVDEELQDILDVISTSKEEYLSPDLSQKTVDEKIGMKEY